MIDNIEKEKITLTLKIADDMTNERLQRFPNYGVYIHARDQVEFIRGILANGKIPNQKEKDFVDIALMSVKELDVSDPDFSDVLCELSYQFKRLSY